MHLFSFFLCAVGFLLFAFAFHLLLTKQGKFFLNRLLSLSLLSRFWQICIFLIIISPYQQFFPIVYKIGISIFFISPALSYLYVRYFIRDEKQFLKQDFLHFIPVVFPILHILPISFGYSVNWDNVANQILEGGQLSISERTGLFPNWVYNFVFALLWLGYLVVMWYCIISSGILQKKWKTGKVWILFYAVMSSFFRLLTFVALIFNVMNHSYSRSPVFLIVSCSVLLFMMIFVLYQPQILYGYIIVSGNHHNREKDKPEIKKENANSANKNSLNSKQQNIYNDIIQKFMEEKQPFLNPDFQMKDLSVAVDIPVHHCSFVINYIVGKNFRDWLNAYRIQYFISEYPKQSESMTIESVSLQAGFKNTSTFYNAFRKETGEMPGSYFKEM